MDMGGDAPERVLELDFATSAGEVVLTGTKGFVAGMLLVICGYIVANLWTLSEPGVLWVTLLDAALACILAPLLVAIWRGWVPPVWADATLPFAAFVSLANIVGTILIYADPADLRYIPYVSVAVGSFMLSTRWLTVYLLTAALCSIPVAGALTSESDFGLFVATFLVGGVVAAGIHITRLRSIRRITELRIKDANQTQQLANALQKAEQELEDHKLTERRRQELETQLRQAQKMEAIGLLAGGIAHDMNNILAAIMLLGSTLKEGQGSEEQDATIEELLESARRGRDFTQNLLGFARRGEYRREKVRCTQVVDAMVALVERTHKNVQVKTEVEQGLDELDGDSTLLGQVLLNLCLNSVDAGAKTITVRARNTQPTSSERLVHPHLTAARYVRLEVIDDGQGMDAQAIERAFEPFFTTKAEGKGTGLGLAMVYGTVTGHGGTVSIESEVGVMTRVTVLLPSNQAAPEPAHKSDKLVALPKKLEGAGRTLLLVDDEDLVRRSAARILKSMGFEILHAENGRQALEVYQEHRARGPGDPRYVHARHERARDLWPLTGVEP